MVKIYCFLIIVCFALHAFAQAITPNNWFEQRTVDQGVELCDPNVPRIRKPWSSLTVAERSLFVQLIWQLKQHQEAYTVGSTVLKPLYDAFVEIHHGPNSDSGWHYTSQFAYAHKGLLWMYESALRYVALVDGPNMQPPVTRDQACSFALAYWDWEWDWDSAGKKIYSSEIWNPPSLFGSPTTVSPYYYVTDGNFSDPGWVPRYSSCSLSPSTSSVDCSKGQKDTKLKRFLFPNNTPKLDPSQVLTQVFAKPNAGDFTTWICGTGHGPAHIFIGGNMGVTSSSPDEPLFFLHHCNVDKFFHLWGSCHGHDAITSDSLGTSQYCNVNPAPGGNAVKSSGVPVQFTLENRPTYYLDGGSYPVFLPTFQDFPRIRDLWSMGAPGNLGWKGLHVRYQDDGYCFSTYSSVCKHSKGWTWFVPQAPSQKRDTATSTNADILYENMTTTFLELTEKKGMSPQEAMTKMAMDACLASPYTWTEEDKQQIGAMGFPLSDFQRICDQPIKNDPYYRPMHHH